MSSAEARRSPRVLAQIPILITGEGPLYNGHTAVVNRHGAMVLCPENYPLQTVLEIQNLASDQCAKCRVVWLGGEDRPGTYKLGIELVEELPEFWRVDYQSAIPAPPPS